MYGKVFASLWEGTLVGDADAQLVFVFMIAHCGRDGVFDRSQEHVSALTGIPLDRVREACERLEAPDPRSRTPGEDGRRILRVDEHRDWGWLVVNRAKYRDTANPEDAREQTRARVAALRERRRAETPRLALDGLGEAGPPSEPSDGPGSQPRGKSARTGRRGKDTDEWWMAFADYFWPLYPRRVARSDAERAWAKLVPSQELLDSIVSGLARWTAAHQREIAEDGMPHVPHASTWINQRRWEDEDP